MKIKTKIKNGNEVTAFDLDDLVEMKVGKEYKMVQVYINSTAKIIFGETNMYHCEILEAYLTELGLPFSLVSLPATETPGPDKIGPDYTVGGGGRAIISDDELKFFGESIGYRNRPNSDFDDMCWRQIKSGLESIASGYKKEDSLFKREGVSQIQSGTIELKTASQEIKTARQEINVASQEIKQASYIIESGDEDKMLLEDALELLHSCLVPSGFEKTDELVEKFRLNAPRYGEKYVSAIERMSQEYIVLKELGKTGNSFDKQYISKLAEIRDILLGEIIPE